MRRCALQPRQISRRMISPFSPNPSMGCTACQPCVRFGDAFCSRLCVWFALRMRIHLNSLDRKLIYAAFKIANTVFVNFKSKQIVLSVKVF